MDTPTLDPGKIKYPRSFRNFLIEPLAQFRMGLRLVMINLAFLLAMAMVIATGYFAQYTLLINGGGVVTGTGLEIQHPTLEVLIRHTIALSVIFVIFISLLVITVVIYTHRIYGAALNIKRFIATLSTGEYGKRCTLRSNDELQDVAEKLNELAQALQSKYEKTGPRDQ